MISTRNLLSSPNHLSTLLSLSSSSSSISSSSSASNNNSNTTTTINNNNNNNNFIDSTPLDLTNITNALNTVQQSNNNNNNDINNLINAFFLNNDININSSMFNQQEQLQQQQQQQQDSNQIVNTNDLFNIQQRRNSSFHSANQTYDEYEEEDEEENDEHQNNFNLFRKRFNSVGSHVDMTYFWPNNSIQTGNVNNMIDVNNNNSRRHNSVIVPSEMLMNKREQRTFSFNYNDSNNGLYIEDTNNNNNNADLISKSLGRNLNIMTNQMKSFNNCLNPKCNHSNENLEIFRFVCNSCQSAYFMHALCYKKMQHAKRNSFNSQYNLLSENLGDLSLNCNSCLIGVLNLVSNQSPNKHHHHHHHHNHHHNNHHQNNSQFKTNSTSTPFINNLNNNNESPRSIVLKQNNKQQPQQSPVSSLTNNNLRKKSLCLNNPPLPTPMQSVRESRSPSPSPISQTNTTTKNAINNHFSNNTNNGYKTNNKRQSAPVNIALTKNRFRTMSTGSTGSFSANSSFSSSIGQAFCTSPNSAAKKILNTQTKPDSPDQSAAINNKPSSPNFSSSFSETNVGEKLASSGNMFYSRDDWSILNHVPFSKQNAIHIRLEDEGPYGNDETRCFLLSHFSTLGIREIACVVCASHLNIYDRFPLIDGTFYVSPVNYDSLTTTNSDNNVTCSVPANIANKNQFIYAICLNCLHATNNKQNVKCKSCKQIWKGGSSLQIGTMYRYEIFAAFPCCQKRLNCSKCDTPIVNLKTGGLQYFSSYSDEVVCNVCSTKDFHFIKPLRKFYEITDTQ